MVRNMKKILAFLIAAAQLIPCITVSAAQPFPQINRWVYEDFENSDISHITAVNSTLTRNRMQTYGDSDGSLEVSVTKNSGAPSFTMEQKAGVAYEISCYIKMKENPLIDQVQFVFQAPSIDDPSKKAYNTVSVTNAGLKAGQWTHITARYVCDGRGKLVGVSDRVNVSEQGTVDIRLGNGNIADTSPNGSTVDYYLDDFTILPVISANDGNLVSDGDFESAGALSSWTKSGSATVSLVDDEYGQCAYVQGKSNLSNIAQTVPIKFNTDYTISFKLKTDDENTLTQQVQMILDRHASKTDDNIANYQYLRDETNMTIGSQWTEYNIRYRYDIDTEDEAYPSVYLRIGSGSADIRYYIDDVRITETNAAAKQDTLDILLDGAVKQHSTITAEIDYNGAAEIEGYIVSAARKSGDTEAIVYSAVTENPQFDYTVTENDSDCYLVFTAYAVTSDGKIAAKGSEMTQKVSGESSITSEIKTDIWTDGNSEVSGTANIRNAEKSFRLMTMIALYNDEGTMLDVGLQHTDIAEGDNIDIDVSVENNSEATFAKLFTFDEDNLEPYTDAKILNKITDVRFIFVDGETGRDTADGTADSPLKTVKAAKEAASKLVPYGNVYVMLKGGTYRQDAALSFTPSALDKNNKIIFTSYDGRAEISGGRKIDGWTLYDSENNIYRAEAGADIDFRQIYIDGVRGIRARSEGGLTNAKMTDTGYTSSDTALQNISHPEDLEMVYYVKWTNPRCSVSSISVSGNTAQITMNPTGWNAVQNKGQSSVTSAYLPSYYENAYELLDEEGEWYFDKSSGYLYYKPRFFENMETADVEIPILEKLVTIRGTADNNATNLEFRDIDFKYTTWNKPTTQGYLSDTQNNHQNGVTGGLPDAALELSYVDGITFTGCEFAKLGITAMKLTEGVKNCNITENEFYDISGTAVSLGVPSGDYARYINPTDERYVVRNNRINGNYIHHTGVEYNSAAAISAAFPKDTQISHNEIFDSPYSGLHLGYGWATYAANGTATENFSVEGNYIHNVLNNKIYDGGAIYTIGNTSGNGYNKISKNYIKDVKNMYGALYPDEGSQYWEFSSNVMDLSAYPLLYGAGGGSGTQTKWLHLWTDSITNNRIVNNYSTTSNMRNDGIGNEVEEPTICDASSWTPEAEDIINASGISAYTAEKFKKGLQDVEALTEYSADAGDEINLSITAVTDKGERYDYRYSDIYAESSDESVAAVDNNFKVRAVSSGTAYIKTAIVEKGIIKPFTMKITVN